MAQDLIAESGVYPVNANGEIVLQSGTGGNVVVGYINSSQVPTDTSTNKMVVKLPVDVPQLTANSRSLQTVGGLIPLATTTPHNRFVFLGDSLTEQPGRMTGFYGGIPMYGNTSAVMTNLGGVTWIVQVKVDGRAGTAGGTLDHDGLGNVRWKYSTDSYGPYQSVLNGGWYYLQSGTVANSGCLISVRGATIPPTAGSGTVTTSGLVSISDYTMHSYTAWVAGGVSEVFSDIQPWGISGASSADVLKFAPQALSSPVEAVSILCGVNDNPSTPEAAAASIANIKAIIDLACSVASRVYVNDLFPCPSQTATVQKYYSLVSTEIKKYTRTKINARFVSAFDIMANPNTIAVAGRTGVMHTDNLHLTPYGGYKAAIPLIAAIKQDYQLDKPRRQPLASWDATLKAGSLNTNASLRGTAGTVTGSAGITGTVPDNWTLSRTGTTQTCVTAFEAATDGGADWYTLSVAGAASGDKHELTQTVNIPSGFAVGDYFVVDVEIQFGACAAPGLVTLQAQVNTNNNANSSYVFQLSRNVSTFTTELPVLNLSSEPQRVLPGVTNFSMNFRIGADSIGGAGKVGLRTFSIRKADGPLTM